MSTHHDVGGAISPQHRRSHDQPTRKVVELEGRSRALKCYLGGWWRLSGGGAVIPQREQRERGREQRACKLPTFGGRPLKFSRL